ncbi:MAG TPA: choice-of-anchor X domain-containing protein [Thermoanaerobaculia bacterium]|nr:choice-of-anchor X domain-containing protein [Thermoanaerobaculia bacterium]
MKILFALALFPASLFAADSVGTFAPGEVYQPPAAHAPANVSRMYARTLTPDARALELPAAGDSSMIVWTLRNVSARLVTPTGRTLEPDSVQSPDRSLQRFRFDGTELGLGNGSQQVLHVARAEAATYRLEAAVQEAVTVVAAEPESRITLSTWAAPLSRQPGEPVTLHAELREGTDAVTEGRVTARLAPANGKAGESVELFDDGGHDDGAANDGIYAVTLNELPQDAAGLWQVRFEADGRTSSGARFARTGSGELMAERDAAHLDAASIHATVSGEALRITAAVDVRIAGNYRFDVIAADTTTRAALAWAEAPRALVTGPSELSVEIPLALLGTNARSLHLDVRLLGLDTPGVAGRVEREVSLSR